jgi:glycosyltransferase involved in cell wall biosynthesis
VVLNDGWLNQELAKAGIESIVIENKYSYDPFYLWRLIRLIKSRRVDIIHAHEFMMNVYGAVAGLITGAPVVTTVHGKKYFFERLRRRLLYRFVARSTAMVAVSQDLRRFIAEKVGTSEGRIGMICNGIDCKNYTRSEGLDSLRNELGISPGTLVVGTVGNLYPVKGYNFLLQAVSRVIREASNVIFLIIGRGRLKNELEQQAADLGINRQVKFLGFRSDVPRLLQLMDVFVMSSLSEGLSLSILEAMAAGKPVVATWVGGNPEIVQEGRTGFLVPSGDSDVLGSRILTLLKNRDLVKSLGDVGRKRVEENFSAERMAAQYQELYQRLLSG